jgi:hypothetical protein
MPTWKRILFKSLGVGVGIGIGLGLAVGSYIWYSSRPQPQKPWDSKALTATFLTADTTGDDSHFRFSYILENHTNRDYRVNTSDLYLSAVLQEQSTLTGSGKGDVKLEQDSIFLPAKDHAQISIVLPSYRYAGLQQPADTASAEEHKKYHDAVKKYVDEKLPRLDGFAAFDDANRYRINFPRGWHTQSGKSPLSLANQLSGQHARWYS